MNNSTGRWVILAAALAMLAIGSASAEDEAIVNASRAAASSTNVGGVSAYRNPLAPPAADSAVAEPRSSCLAVGCGWDRRVDRALAARVRLLRHSIYLDAVLRLGVDIEQEQSEFPRHHLPLSGSRQAAVSQGYCSASVILRSVIVTAAHCIQTFGSGAAIFTNHRFIRPTTSRAKPRQLAPYGTWTWAPWRVQRAGSTAPTPAPAPPETTTLPSSCWPWTPAAGSSATSPASWAMHGTTTNSPRRTGLGTSPSPQ